MAELSIPIDVIRAIDGDTLEGDLLIRVRVRLKECWADKAGTLAGDLATANLRDLAEGKRGVFRMPYDVGKGLTPLFSFSRPLGYVKVDDVDLSTAQVLAGHATKEKQ